MSVSHALNIDVLTKALEEPALLGTGAGTSAGTVAPEDILRFLARLRMLEGVPFNTLVPDNELFQLESLRQAARIASTGCRRRSRRAGPSFCQLINRRQPNPVREPKTVTRSFRSRPTMSMLIMAMVDSRVAAGFRM